MVEEEAVLIPGQQRDSTSSERTWRMDRCGTERVKCEEREDGEDGKGGQSRPDRLPLFVCMYW